MIKYCPLLLAVLFSSLPTKALSNNRLKTDSNTSSEPAIRATLQNYFTGRKSANIDLLRQAFAADARLVTVSKQNSIQVITLEEYFRIVEQQGKVSVVTTIENILIDGSIGFAKVKFEYSDKSYTDHLALVRANDGWKIVSKSFVQNNSATNSSQKFK